MRGSCDAPRGAARRGAARAPPAAASAAPPPPPAAGAAQPSPQRDAGQWLSACAAAIRPRRAPGGERRAASGERAAASGVRPRLPGKIGHFFFELFLFHRRNSPSGGRTSCAASRSVAACARAAARLGAAAEGVQARVRAVLPPGQGGPAERGAARAADGQGAALRRAWAAAGRLWRGEKAGAAAMGGGGMAAASLLPPVARHAAAAGQAAAAPGGNSGGLPASFGAPQPHPSVPPLELPALAQATASRHAKVSAAAEQLTDRERALTLQRRTRQVRQGAQTRSQERRTSALRRAPSRRRRRILSQRGSHATHARAARRAARAEPSKRVFFAFFLSRGKGKGAGACLSPPRDRTSAARCLKHFHARRVRVARAGKGGARSAHLYGAASGRTPAKWWQWRSLPKGSLPARPRELRRRALPRPALPGDDCPARALGASLALRSIASAAAPRQKPLSRRHVRGGRPLARVPACPPARPLPGGLEAGRAFARRSLARSAFAGMHLTDGRPAHLLRRRGVRAGAT